MLGKLKKIKETLQSEIEAAATLKDAEQLKIKYLGRRGIVNDLMKLIPTLPIEQRATFGQQINSLKIDIADSIEGVLKKLSSESTPKVKKEIFDVTLPGTLAFIGRLHPLTQTIEDIKEVFNRLGFDIAYGPEIELEYYNFDALNIPPDHPSRTDFDTFYIKNDIL